MVKKISIVLLMISWGATQAALAGSPESTRGTQGVYYTKQEVLKTFFPQSEKLDPMRLAPTSEQKKRVEERLGGALQVDSWILYRATTNGELDGYAYLGQAMGRSQPFGYAVKLDPEGAVRELAITEYHSPRGAEIRQARFADQFVGKKASDELRLGRDIDAVSGATINSKSITEGIRQALIVFEELAFAGQALAPQDKPAESGMASETDPDIVTRGMRQQRLASPTPIGGYGEMHLNVDLTDMDDPESTIDMHRLVLFVAHQFTSQVSMYTELEVEHALASEGAPGEVGVEQAFLDYQFLAADSAIGEFGVRAGIVLVPMGIINQWHEPPIFHGVERPMSAKNIIPTTWREGGIGFFGRPIPELRYEIYLFSGLNPGKFRAKDGLRKGRQAVAEARTNGLAVAGRIELEPIPSVVFGIAGYASKSGPNLSEAFTAAGDEADLDVWVTGFSLDARGRFYGLEARAMFATFFIGDTPDLRQLVDADGESLGLDVGAQLLGGYFELAYDLLDQVDTDHQLLPFVRLEYVDTMEAIKGRDRSPDDDDRQFVDVVAGLSYRPIPQAVFKFDIIQRFFGGQADDQTILDLGVGFMF